MEWKNELIPDFVAAIYQYGECDEHKEYHYKNIH